MDRRIVLIGAGHAHLEPISLIRRWTNRQISVHVVAPSEYYYYSGMGPGMLGGIYHPEEIRFPIRKMVEDQGGVFHKDTVVLIDAERGTTRLASGKTLDYDVLSCNTGSTVADQIVEPDAEDVYTVKPISNLLSARQRISLLLQERDLRLAVVGGGPSALEIAGNLRRLCSSCGSENSAITIYAGEAFMPSSPGRVRRLARKNLLRRKIKIEENGMAAAIGSHVLKMETGITHHFDVLFLAAGVRPSGLFAESLLLTGPDGGLAVNRFLQCPRYPDIFGGGDCIYFRDNPLNKAGFHAVKQSPILGENLFARMENAPLKPYSPPMNFLLAFNLGDGTGIFWRKKIVFNGRTAFRIKDRIDRRFMNRYQFTS